MTKDEAMRLALAILLEYHEKENGLWGRTEDAIEALRTALAQPEHEPEPVAVVASLKINAQKALLARGFMLTSPLYIDLE